MKNISKILMTVLMALGLLLGGLVASVPAQAQTDAGVSVTQSTDVTPMVGGSTVSYAGCSSDGCGKPIYMTNTSGIRRAVSMGNHMTNVFRLCPYSIGQKLIVRTPGGSYIYLAYGQCYSPGSSGQWRAYSQG